MKILLQFPEGLKQRALEYVRKYEAQGHEVFVSSSACYGACDLALDEAKKIGAKKLVHFGHAKFIRKKLPIAVEYIEWHEDVDLANIAAALPRLAAYDRVGIATTVQHIHQLNKIKKLFESNGKIVFIGKGTFTFYPGQMLGCDSGAISSIEKKVDAIVFIGDGMFHPLALDVQKPAFLIHHKTGGIRQINDEIEKLRKKRKGAMLAALDAKSFAVLVSTKPGQCNVVAAQKIKQELARHGRSATVLIANEFYPIALNNFMCFDCYITTACPRIVDDSESYGKPILDIKMFSDLMKLVQEMERKKS